MYNKVRVSQPKIKEAHLSPTQPSSSAQEWASYTNMLHMIGSNTLVSYLDCLLFSTHGTPQLQPVVEIQMATSEYHQSDKNK